MINKKSILFILISVLIGQNNLMAQEAEKENSLKIKSWTPEFEFNASSEFRYDIKENIPGMLNAAGIKFYFKPSENPKLSKGEISGFIEIKDLQFRSELSSFSDKQKAFQLIHGDIIAQLNVHDFFIKISTLPSMEYDTAKLFSSAPITKFEAYNTKVTNDYWETTNILGRKMNLTGSLTFGYDSDLFYTELSLGAFGHADKNKDIESDKDKKNEYNKEKAFGLGGKFTLKNIMQTDISLGFSSAFGNDEFMKRTIGTETEGRKLQKFTSNSPNFTNSLILSSLGTKTKLPLNTKINGKNTYLIFNTGIDFGFDPNGERHKTAMSGALGMTFAWNTKEGDEESFNVDGNDTYSKILFGEKDKVSGLTVGINYGKSLDKQTEDESNFNRLNLGISTYEDGKKGIIPGLGWILSLEALDLLENNMKVGLAAYVDYHIAFKDISSDTYLVPYLGTFNVLKKDKVEASHIKAGVILKKFLPYVNLALGYDSSNFMESEKQLGSVFTKLVISF